MRILLVEDSKTILKENEAALVKAGYDVICAEDGEFALEMAHAGQPDLILLDMILPKISGPEVLRRLKRDPNTASIPVVVVSSLSERNREKLVEDGAEDYLEKGSLMPGLGVNRLPQELENVICRINRRRDKILSSTQK